MTYQVGKPARWARKLLALATGMLLLFTVTHFARAWYTGGNLGQSSGIIIGQAIDLTHGVFYRPLASDLGFGGTRYMPLSFVLVAPLIRAGMEPVTAAIAITLLADLGLLCGIYVLLRRLEVQKLLAWTGAVLVLAAGCGQYATTTVRADLLPAVMNVWGLAFAVGNDRYRSRPALAAVFFVLAFTGKLAALYGAAACVVAMTLSGRWRDAFKLAGLMLTGIVLFLGVMHFASSGRFAENLRACADGGVTWDYVRTYYWRRLYRYGLKLDWTGSALIALAGLSVLRMRLRELAQVPFWAMAITGVATFGLFASPGVSFNVFLDLVIVCVVFFVLQVGTGRMPFAASAVVLSIISLGAIAYLVQKHADRGINRRQAATLATLAGKGGGPLLSKPPVLAVFAEEAPYVLDPWMYRHLPQHDQFNKQLCNKLREGYFRAVVIGNLESSKVEESIANQFGWGFTAAMGEGYAEAVRVVSGKRLIGVVWKPKSQIEEGPVRVVKVPVHWSTARWWQSIKRRLALLF